jgi:putative heme-binding domain-containing protein
MVHRKTLTPNGISFTATRADEGVEFITSTDNWFRPTNFVNGPDGCLYILDMYRETIEHPASIPEDIKQHLDLEGGDDRGRIWRLVPPGWWPRPFANLADMPSGQLVAQLQSSNAWNRETAQRLLWERQDAAAVNSLVKLTEISAFPTARLHALYALQGLGALNTETIVRGLGDASPRVREHAIRVAESDGAAALTASLSLLADDPDLRVRWQLALTLGEFPRESAQPILSRLAARDSLDPEVRQAMLTSLKESLVPAVFSAIERSRGDASGTSAAWLSELCLLVGSDAKTDGTVAVLNELVRANEPGATADVVLAALGQGLGRRGRTFEGIVARDGIPESIRSLIGSRFVAATDRAIESESPAEQVSAIALLKFAPLALLAAVAEELSWPQTPPEVQIELARSLSAHPDDAATDWLLSEWSVLSPTVRSEAVDGLMRTPARIARLLESVELEVVRPSELAPDKRQALLTHPSEAVRARAAELFEAASADRQQVITEYEPALDAEPDLNVGRQVFAKTCINCHRVGEEGHNVGPDLASVSNKSAGDLLVAILDPNREAQPNYTNYNIALLDGRVVTGIIVNETADTITLRRAEGKEDVILRSQIDLLQSTGLSIMPVGLEKDISAEQLASVIAFIRSIPATAGPSQ